MIENVLFGGDGVSTRYLLNFTGCLECEARSARLWGGGAACLYVTAADGITSTALRFDAVACEDSVSGVGASLMGWSLELSSCVFESNYGHGVVVQIGSVAFTQPYFEANGDDDMVLGNIDGGDSELSYVSVINPYFSNDRTAGKRAIYCNYLGGGAIIGGSYTLYDQYGAGWSGATVIEMTNHTRNVDLIGINPGTGVVVYDAAHSNTLANYPGLISYTNPGGRADLVGMGLSAITASYRMYTTQTISGTTPTRLNFSVQEWDSNSAVTTGSSWVFTCPTAGIYRITTNLNIQYAASGTVFIQVVNGTTVMKSLSLYGAGAYANGCSFVVELQCAYHDPLSVQVVNTTGGTITIDSIGYAPQCVHIEKIQGS